MAEIEVGDIVQIKSGGPLMTVVSIDADGVHCIWYGESSEEIRTATIPVAALGVVDLADDEDLDDEDEDDEDEDESPPSRRKR